MMRFCSILSNPSEAYRKESSSEVVRWKSKLFRHCLFRCEEIGVEKDRLFRLKTYSKSLKRFIKVAVWYSTEEDMTKWKIYFSPDDSMSTKDVIN